MINQLKYIVFALVTIFTFTLMAESSDISLSQEIHKKRSKHYDDILNVFKKFNINPEKINKLLFDGSKTSVSEYLKELSGQAKNLKHQRDTSENKEQIDLAMTEVLSLMRAKIYQSEIDQEKVDNMPEWAKKIFSKHVFPLGKNIMMVVMRKDVITSSIDLYTNPRLSRVLYSQLILLFFIIVYKFYRRRYYKDLFFKRLFINVGLSVLLFVGSAFVLPSLLVGKPYIDFISALSTSAYIQINDENNF